MDYTVLTYEQLKSRFLASGLKVTQQRLVVYQALTKLAVHPTAEQVYEHVRIANPSISLATVYKTLDTFVESELIRRVMTDDGFMRYDAHLEPHSHVYCTNTKEIIDFIDPELTLLLEEYFKRKKIPNLKIKDFSLQINAEKISPEEDIIIE